MEKNKYKILSTYLLAVVVLELGLLVLAQNFPPENNFGGLDINSEAFSDMLHEMSESAGFRLCSLESSANPKCVIGVKAPLNSQSVNING